MQSRLDGHSGDVRTHDRKRCAEILDFQLSETVVLEHLIRRPVRMAAVSHAPPRRPDGRLDTTQQRSACSCNVLDEDEAATGLQHADNFIDCSSLVDDTTKNERAYHGVDGFSLDGQILRCSRAQIDSNSEALGFLPEMLAHVGIRLDSDPEKALAREVAQVSSGAGANLKHGPGEVREEPLLMGSKIVVSLVSEPGHEPGKEAKADWAGSSTNFGNRAFVLVNRVLQCFHYTASSTAPP